MYSMLSGSPVARIRLAGPGAAGRPRLCSGVTPRRPRPGQGAAGNRHGAVVL